MELRGHVLPRVHPCRVVISVNGTRNVPNLQAGLIRARIAEGDEVLAVAAPDGSR